MKSSRQQRKLRLQEELLRKLLVSAREKAGLTQAHVGAQLDRDQTFVSKLESGRHKVEAPILEQLAELYGENLGFFSTLEKVKASHPQLAKRPKGNLISGR